MFKIWGILLNLKKVETRSTFMPTERIVDGEEEKLVERFAFPRFKKS